MGRAPEFSRFGSRRQRSKRWTSCVAFSIQWFDRIGPCALTDPETPGTLSLANLGQVPNERSGDSSLTEHRAGIREDLSLSDGEVRCRCESLRDVVRLSASRADELRQLVGVLGGGNLLILAKRRPVLRALV